MPSRLGVVDFFLALVDDSLFESADHFLLVLRNCTVKSQAGSGLSELTLSQRPIMASKNQKQYDLVLLGATGYTGKLCAEHIATRLPTNLKWAVAGRTIGKLENIVDGLKSYNADRLQPGK